jgi:hypothetical protein
MQVLLCWCYQFGRIWPLLVSLRLAGWLGTHRWFGRWTSSLVVPSCQRNTSLAEWPEKCLLDCSCCPRPALLRNPAGPGQEQCCQLIGLRMRPVLCSRARKLVDGSNITAEGLKCRKLWKGLRPADRDFGPETGGFSTKSPAKLHSARPLRLL